MSAIAVGPQNLAAPAQVTETTLLELVKAISEVARDEREIVAVVVDLLQRGRAKLVGNFRSMPVEIFQASLRD
jgi:predicted nucleic-acid-binding protein